MTVVFRLVPRPATGTSQGKCWCDVVRQLLLGKGFEFEAVGDAELKSFSEPVSLFEDRSR